MFKKFFSLFGLVALTVLMTGLLSAAAPMPVTTFTLLEGDMPTVMNVGDTYTVVVRVDSNQPFVSAQAMADFQFAGKGVVAVQGGDHAGQGSSAILQVTFKAKSPTAKMPGGVVPFSLVVGVRYGGGYVAVERYDFVVQVP